MGISLQEILGANLGEAFKEIVSAFKCDPTIKEQLIAQIDANKDTLLQKEMDLNAKLNDVAGANIRAEQQSGDKYVTRARPSVIWWGLGLIVFNYGVVNLVSHWTKVTPVDLPQAFWWTWGTVVTGYVFNRSAQEIMQMPGESSLKLPFGIQIGQNSPKP